jgi:HSP20 family protein
MIFKELNNNFFNSHNEIFQNPFKATLTTESSPRFNVSETDNQFIVEAAIPGINSENLNMKVVAQDLSISYEKNENEKQETDRKYHLIERKLINFKRTFRFPKTADMNSINAEYKNGMLTISITKQEEAKPREIKVEVH